MKPTFKDLFRFNQKEISIAFNLAKFKNKINGLKLLQFPIEAFKNVKSNELANVFDTQIKQNTGKILIIISGKVGKAHDRNQLRRRIKNIFYEEKLYEKPVISILITYKEALNLTFDQLKQFLKESFE